MVDGKEAGILGEAPAWPLFDRWQVVVVKITTCLLEYLLLETKDLVCVLGIPAGGGRKMTI